MKTIKQLSAELCISKEAIYKKLKFQLKNELNGHITKVNNVTHIDGEGEQIIRGSLKRERQEALQGVIDGESPGEQDNPSHITEYIQLLEEQLKTKDAQIETQNSHIGVLIRQMGSSQLLNQAERIKGLLPASAEVGTYGDPRRKSIWKRIFNNR